MEEGQGRKDWLREGWRRGKGGRFGEGRGMESGERRKDWRKEGEGKGRERSGLAYKKRSFWENKKDPFSPETLQCDEAGKVVRKKFSLYTEAEGKSPPPPHKGAVGEGSTRGEK